MSVKLILPLFFVALICACADKSSIESETLGKFNTERDLYLAHFDLRPMWMTLTLSLQLQLCWLIRVLREYNITQLRERTEPRAANMFLPMTSLNWHSDRTGQMPTAISAVLWMKSNQLQQQLCKMAGKSG